MVEWHREDLALVTNLSTRELPMTAVGQHRLPEIPLLVSSAGLIADFLRRWYGPDFQSRLTIVAGVDSIYYGLALLRSQLVHGALICAHAAAAAAIEGRLPGGPGLRWCLWPATTTRPRSCWPGSSPAKVSANSTTTPTLSTCCGVHSPLTPNTGHRDELRAEMPRVDTAALGWVARNERSGPSPAISATLTPPLP